MPEASLPRFKPIWRHLESSPKSSYAPACRNKFVKGVCELPKVKCGECPNQAFIPFDDARLDTLFLALPLSWKGTLIQYTGRLHRPHPRKTEVRIFDYVDRDVPMLLRMFEKRLRGYRAIGYVRGEAPLGYAEPGDDVAVEYDEEVPRSLKDFDSIADGVA